MHSGVKMAKLFYNKFLFLKSRYVLSLFPPLRIDPDWSKQRHGWSIFRLKCIIHTCLIIHYTYLPIGEEFINQNSNYLPFSVKVGFLCVLLPWGVNICLCRRNILIAHFLTFSST
jgi:hypothetical protein